ncbi:hypothetical protein ABH966_004653 [Lysinibacillus sp. RC46]|uniref:hypothetical protein n=1 Tax=unclassified Lysinibacillus TaxID=2636778 RepID=UPI00351499AB
MKTSWKSYSNCMFAYLHSASVLCNVSETAVTNLSCTESEATATNVFCAKAKRQLQLDRGEIDMW